MRLAASTQAVKGGFAMPEFEWAEDLRTIAWLHSAEVAPAALATAYEAGFPMALALPLVDDDIAALVAGFAQSVRELLDGQPDVDELAADYAAIYLTHAFRASPCESVWRDEDNLMLQGPTFAVRAFYRRHGLIAKDWRTMADDHVCLELEFVATLLERGEPAAAQEFLDQHLLQWLPRFADAVEARAGTRFYRLLARLTARYCEGLRAALRLRYPKAD